MSAPTRIGLVRSPLGDDAYRLWNRYGGDTSADSPINYVRTDIVDEMLSVLKSLQQPLLVAIDIADQLSREEEMLSKAYHDVQDAIAKAEGETE